jgi:pyruvate dehydrogenase E2 component (dihydrolipoamide acetyltransferase)
MLQSDYNVCKPLDRSPMTTDVLMPQLGLEVTEATVIEVFVSVGDEVAQAHALFELETDKAITEVAAPAAGFVVAIHVEPGQVVPVGAVLARLGETAAETAAPSAPATSTGNGASAESDPPVVEVAAGFAQTLAAPPAAGAGGGRQRVAPVARRAAAELGVTLEHLAGSGPRGRITLDDVKRAAAANGSRTSHAPSQPAVPDHAGEIEPLGRLRRTIARRMTASQLIPQYQLERDLDASSLLAQRTAQTAAAGSGPRPGVTDLLIQAMAEMVVRHPILGATYVEDPEPHLERHDSVDIGLAVATDRGLLVPVIRAAHQIGLCDISAARQRGVDAARAGTISLQEMSGGTVTLSNLGGFGVDRFTAMLNPGESAILAVGRTAERVVPRGRGLTVVPIMTLTMTFDHRVIDGAVGAAALAELAQLLEGTMVWRP